MNHLLKVVALFLITSGTYAQTISDVQIGPDNKQTSKIIKIFGDLNGQVYALGATNKNYFVQMYDPNGLNLLTSEKMDLPEIEGLSKIEIEEFFLMEKSLMVIFSGVNKSDETVDLYAYKVSPDCKLSSTGKRVLSVVTSKKKNSGDVGIEYNEALNRVLIFHQTKISTSEGFKLSVASVDEDLKDIQSGVHMLPIPKGMPDYKVLDVLLSRDGNIYALDNNVDAEAEEFSKYKKQELHLVTFLNNGGGYSASEEIVTLKPDYYITDAMLYDYNSLLAITGLFIDTKNGKGKELDGAFNTEFQKEGTLEEPHIFPFTESFKEKFDARIGYRERLQGSMKIKDARIVGNTMYVVAENVYLVEGDPTYENMLIYKINDGKTIEWAQALGKRQTYAQVSVSISAGSAGNLGASASVSFKLVSNDVSNYLSYYCWTGEDAQLHVLFNDSKRNAEITGEGHRKWLMKPQDGVPTVATLSTDGTIKFEVEEAMQNEDIPIRPKYALADDNVLFFVAGRRSSECLSRAKLNR